MELDCFSLIKFMVYTNSITSPSVWMVASEARSLTHIHHQGTENQGLPPRAQSPEDDRTELKLLTRRNGSEATEFLNLGLVFPALRRIRSLGAYARVLDCHLDHDSEFCVPLHILSWLRFSNVSLPLSHIGAGKSTGLFEPQVSYLSLSCVDGGFPENNRKLREVTLHAQEHTFGINRSWVSGPNKAMTPLTMTNDAKKVFLEEIYFKDEVQKGQHTSRAISNYLPLAINQYIRKANGPLAVSYQGGLGSEKISKKELEK